MFNTRSFCFSGLAIGMTAVFAEPVEVKPPQQKTLASTSGRFVFGQISDYRRDQYLLDTASGRLWQKVCAKSDEKSTSQDDCVAVLQIIPYVGTDDKWSVTPK